MHACERYRPARHRRALPAVVLTVAVVAASGCGFSKVLDKRDVAARISHSYDLARGAGVASGKAEVSLTIVKLHLPVTVPGLKEGFTTKPQSAPMTIDVGRARWASVVDAGQGPQVVAAFDDAVFYQYNANAGQARPYTAVNIGRLYDQRQQHKGDAAGNSILNPAYMFELLPGVLTGSIKTLGPDTVGDVATTHFQANFDATRALAHAPKDRQHAVAAALALMNVDNSAIKGEVWLDAAGQPRKVLMHLREKV